MKPYQKKNSKTPSKLSIFFRFASLGLCVGLAAMLVRTYLGKHIMLLVFSDTVGFPKIEGQGQAVLVQILDWIDELLLAPLAAYAAGRFYREHRWKFVVSMFIGMEMFPISIVYAVGLGVTLIELAFFLTVLIVGLALSLITFKRGAMAAQAAEQTSTAPAEALPAGESQPASEKENNEILPMPLSQIDYEEVAKRLKEDEERKKAADSEQNMTQGKSEGGDTADEILRESEKIQNSAVTGSETPSAGTPDGVSSAENSSPAVLPAATAAPAERTVSDSQ